MIPTKCRTKHEPPTSYGDCIRACVAAMLDISIVEQVPHFAHDGAEGHIVMQRLREWLAGRDLSAFVVHYPPVSLNELLETNSRVNGDVHYMLFGETGDGGSHVVVAKGGEIVCNPAWYGGTLKRAIGGEFWQAVVICKL